MTKERSISEDDYKIERGLFLEDLAKLCRSYLSKIGDNMISLSVESRVRGMSSDMNGGKCHGAVMDLDVVTWYSNPDVDPLEDMGFEISEGDSDE